MPINSPTQNCDLWRRAWCRSRRCKSSI